MRLNIKIPFIFFFSVKLLVFGLFFLAGLNPYIYCQNGGFKYIKNYSRKEYGRQPQNWAVLQDKRGIIYVGNQGGLLEFDGVSWRTISVPNQSVRSLAMAGDGTVYVGGIDEIGFLAPDAKGTLQYESLLGQLDNDKKNFGWVWRTHWTKQGIYFKTSRFLFRWNADAGQMKVWKPHHDYFYDSFTCNGILYISQETSGLTQMVNGSLEKLPGGDIFASEGIAVIVPFDGQRLLIGAESSGFYIFDGAAMTAKPFAEETAGYLRKNELYYGIRLKSSPGDLALATRLGGLVIADTNGRLKKIFNTNSGLPDNNVKSVFEDSRGNLWLSLEKGISKIEYPSPVSIYDHRSGLSGLVLSVAKHRDVLYAGTTNGLFFLAAPNKFRLVPGMSGNCWSIISTGDAVLAAANNGVFQINNNGSRGIIKNSATVLLRSGINPNRTWVGTRRGLISLYFDTKNNKRQWLKEDTVKGITREIITIVEDREGNLWLGLRAKGVLKVDFPGGGEIAHPVVTSYDTSGGLPAGEVHVFWAAGHVMFASGVGIFRFDEKNKVFVPDLTLGEVFADGSRNVFRIAQDKKKNIWLYSNSRNFQAVPRPDGSFEVIPTPALKLHLGQVNTIYPDPAGDITWYAGNDGLIRYDSMIKNKYRHGFTTLIRRVLVDGDLHFDGYKAGHSLPVRIIDYQDRNIRFQFAAPFFEAESEVQFRCFLEGNDEDWSDWSDESRKDYTNLDAKKYRFRVQARNAYGHFADEADFRFEVLPPWYKTWWAFLGYLAVSFLGIYFIVRWRSGKLEREKQHLEQIVKERTKEINGKNKQLEEQSVKLREMGEMKSRFFANISHEFRTPLTLIMGPLEQMLSRARGKEQKKQLDLMLRNSQRLFTLINQLLDLSKFDSGKMRLHTAPQDIVPFLKGILASFESLAGQNKLALEFTGEEENIIIYFDGEKLEEVFCNLLLNAAKFTPAGGKITVTVKMVKTGDMNFPAGFVEISAADTGIGIPKDQLVHIFDRFYQAEGPGSGEYGHTGTGIGLALAKEMVELHHGKIDVHSRVGKDSGTEFIIRLPIGKGHLKPKEIAHPSRTPYPGGPGKLSPLYRVKEKETDTQTDTGPGTGFDPETGPEAREKSVILIVEDSTDVRKYIRGALEPAYTVVEAANGVQGIQIAKKIIPDLIISDVMMPEKDGCELCGTLKNDIDTSHIPVMLLTAKAADENIIRGLESGADDYITKPFNTKILCTRIKNLIDLRRQMQMKIQRRKKLLPAEISVSSIDESFLKELQDIIEKNLADPEFHIDQLCKKLYMGRTTLFRKIEALTGETPNQFIQSYRLERAAQLLKANFGNITEVAFAVGFSSSAYFTKCFKEKFQQLPSTFHPAARGA